MPSRYWPGGGGGSARPTAAGRAAALLAVLVALAAANTGANLLYLVLGLLVGVLAVGWAAGRGTPPGPPLLDLPRLVAAHAPFRGRVELAAWPAGPASLLVHAPGWLPQAGVLLEVDERGRAVAEFEARAPARGIVRRVEVEVARETALGLWRRRSRLEVAVDVAVHPRLPPPRAAGGVPAGGERAGRRPGAEDGAVRDVAPFRPGDNPRRIHWRLSSRTGDLLVTRRDGGEARRRVIEADLGRPAGAQLESELERVAGEVRDVLVGDGEVELRLGGARVTLAGPGDLERALRTLAGVKGHGA